MLISKIQTANTLRTNYCSIPIFKKNEDSPEIITNNKTDQPQIPNETYKAYANINFKGAKTNYLWKTNPDYYIPLVITAGMSLISKYCSNALPGLECKNGDWTDVYMEGTYLKNSKLQNSVFNQTRMKEAQIHNSDLSGSKFISTSAENTRFNHSDFTNCQIQDCIFTNSTFQKAKFNYANIKNTNFSNANFIGADLSLVNSIDDKTIFDGAIYNDTTKFPRNFSPSERGMIKLEDKVNLASLYDGLTRKLFNVSLENTTLNELLLTESNLEKSKFINVDFYKSIFKGTQAKKNVFNNCDFSQAQFDNKSDFSKSSFFNSTFFGAKFNGAILKNSNLMGADLSDTDFDKLPTMCVEGCFFDMCTIFPEGFDPYQHGLIKVEPYVKLEGLNMSHCKIRNSLSDGYVYNFSGTKLDRADFTESEIDKAIFSGASLRHACFREAKMEYADFENANLRGANLVSGNFRNANFKNADLQWADLSGANLEGADLTGAKYIIPSTKFPQGFNPESRGMIEITYKVKY